MTDYLLFIDTETTGLPKKWDLPYSEEDNWPSCVQVSWVIYDKNGHQIKQEDHYIYEDNFQISKSAIKIHGITPEFLAANGERRNKVMQLLADDIAKYQPLVVGHFMEFDAHMVSVDFYRSGIQSPVAKENTFCTMLATTHMVKNPGLKFLRLGELYETLFNCKLENQHNSLVDAKATAECFFELVKRGEINEEEITRQQHLKKTDKAKPEKKNYGCLILVLVIILLIILFFYAYETTIRNS